MPDNTYSASCGEARLTSVLTEVVAGWMNDEWKQKYREAIANALRRMSADFVTLLPDVDECQGCAGRGAGYCPTCKKWRYGTCGDCGKDLSEEERGQFRCELCSQYPSPEVSAYSARCEMVDREEEDGMGFSGLVPSREEREAEKRQATIGNLAMLVARLVQQVRKHDSSNDVAEKAMDYLKRTNLAGSVLREITSA